MNGYVALASVLFHGLCFSGAEVQYYPISINSERTSYFSEAFATPGRVQLEYSSIRDLEEDACSMVGLGVARSVLSAVLKDSPEEYRSHLCNPFAPSDENPYYWTYLRMLTSKGETELLGAFKFSKETHYVLGSQNKKCTTLPIRVQESRVPCFHPDLRYSPPQRYLYDMVRECAIPGETSPPNGEKLVVPLNIGPDNDIVTVHIPLMSGLDANRISLSAAKVCRELALATQNISSANEGISHEALCSVLTPDSANIYSSLAVPETNLHFGTRSRLEFSNSLQKYSELIEESARTSSAIVLNLHPAYIVIPTINNKVIKCLDVMVPLPESTDCRSLIQLWGTDIVTIMIMDTDYGVRIMGMARWYLGHLLNEGPFIEKCNQIAGMSPPSE